LIFLVFIVKIDILLLRKDNKVTANIKPTQFTFNVQNKIQFKNS